MPRRQITTQFVFEERNAGIVNQLSTGVQRFARFAFSPAGAVAAVAAIGAGVVSLTANYLENADALSKMSQRTGVATEELSGLKLAFDQADLSSDDLEKALRRLNLREPGANIRDMAEEISNLETVQEQSARAAEAFGTRLGPRMLTFLQQGAEGIDAYQDKAENLNLVIDQESADAAAAFNDNIDLMTRVAEGAGTRIGAAIVNWSGPIIASLGVSLGILPPTAEQRTQEMIDAFVNRIAAAQAAGLSFGDALADPVALRLQTLLLEAGLTIDRILDLPNEARGRERLQNIILRDQTRDRLSGPLHPEDADPRASDEARSAAVGFYLRQLERGGNPAAGRGIGDATPFDPFSLSTIRRTRNPGDPGLIYYGSGPNLLGTADLPFIRSSSASQFDNPAVWGQFADYWTRQQRGSQVLINPGNTRGGPLLPPIDGAGAGGAAAAGFVGGIGGGGGGFADPQGLIEASKNDPLRVSLAGLGGLNEDAMAQQDKTLRPINVDGNELISASRLRNFILGVIDDYIN